MKRDRSEIPLGLLEQFGAGFRPERVEAPPGGGGFSGASVSRVHCAAGDYCVRAWPRGGLSAARIGGLHRLLAFVHGRGVRAVAVPVGSVAGTTLSSHAGRLWQVEPWLPGRADYWSNPARERLRAAVRCVANWHRAAALFEPSELERSWFGCRTSAASPAVDERIDVLVALKSQLQGFREQRLASRQSNVRQLCERVVELFGKLARTVEQELRAASRLRFQLQPCLRDVWHDHVLFTGSEVTGLIDASACRTENVATDLARLVGSLVGDDTEAWDAALDEYRRVRELSLDEMFLMQVLDRSGVLLSGMRWVERIAREPELGDDQRVVARLSAIVQRLEQLARTV